MHWTAAPRSRCDYRLPFIAYGRTHYVLVDWNDALVRGTIRAPILTRTGRVWRYVNLSVSLTNGQPTATLIQEPTP